MRRPSPKKSLILVAGGLFAVTFAAYADEAYSWATSASATAGTSAATLATYTTPEATTTWSTAAYTTVSSMYYTLLTTGTDTITTIGDSAVGDSAGGDSAGGGGPGGGTTYGPGDPTYDQNLQERCQANYADMNWPAVWVGDAANCDTCTSSYEDFCDADGDGTVDSDKMGVGVRACNDVMTCEGGSGGTPMPCECEDAYVKECQEAGVPIPPPWGDPCWENKGEVKPTLIVQGSKAELWTCETDEGTCAALPRYNADGSIALMGVICVGNEGCGTCFWDNVDPDDQSKLPVTPGHDIVGGANGNTLEEKCTNCHRGENPWIKIPGQPTEDLEPDCEPDPIGGPGFENPPTTGPGCGSCHDTPALTKEWCGIATEAVANGSMPPGGLVPGSQEATDWAALQAACAALP